MASSGTATVTLPTDEQILITREFDAPKHLVFEAFTTPELVKRWWSARRGAVTIAEIDLRVGGTWRYVMVTEDGMRSASTASTARSCRTSGSSRPRSTRASPTRTSMPPEHPHAHRGGRAHDAHDPRGAPEPGGPRHAHQLRHGGRHAGRDGPPGGGRDLASLTSIWITGRRDIAPGGLRSSTPPGAEQVAPRPPPRGPPTCWSRRLRAPGWGDQIASSTMLRLSLARVSVNTRFTRPRGQRDRHVEFVDVMSSEDRPETCQIDEGHGPEVEHHARGRQVAGLPERTFNVPDDCPVEFTRQGQDQGLAGPLGLEREERLGRPAVHTWGSAWVAVYGTTGRASAAPSHDRDRTAGPHPGTACGRVGDSPTSPQDVSPRDVAADPEGPRQGRRGAVGCRAVDRDDHDRLGGRRQLEDARHSAGPNDEDELDGRLRARWPPGGRR